MRRRARRSTRAEAAPPAISRYLPPNGRACEHLKKQGEARKYIARRLVCPIWVRTALIIIIFNNIFFRRLVHEALKTQPSMTTLVAVRQPPLEVSMSNKPDRRPGKRLAGEYFGVE